MALPPVLSLAMIVKDEAPVLSGVLGDVAAFCDEVVVVDTGSSDDTADVARRHGAAVYAFDWTDDFSAARNFALEHCNGEWVLMLDADDRIPPGSQEAFLHLRNELGGLGAVDMIYLPYRYAFSPIDTTTCTTNFEMGRIFRNHVGLRWTGRIHEIVPVDPARTMRRSHPWVEHRPRPDSRIGKAERNLRLIEKAIEEGDDSHRMAYFLALELRALKRFDDAADAYRELLRRDLSDTERYAALIDLSMCRTDPEHATARIDLLLEAVAVDSSRAEAFTHLALHFYANKRWERAIPLFSAAAACVPPISQAYNEVYYTWFPHDCLAVCLSELGRFDEAIDETVLALVGNPDRPRLLRNLEMYFGRTERPGVPGAD